ncbi:hypothetical protein SAMN04515671_0527 [Nakamurella panacisegetis]|uniref:DUF4352 domain-containing protein n=1 Tax=Nakamurella panacisegetis TaxID=1090615 RepID=A0A1H0IK27_9ACTN|nr:hypothetical protein [Nakamurella panacisegetis]SDO31401.1 hypothetical protein SAMN04515671_0527 [Nakamurella panacisegetis]
MNRSAVRLTRRIGALVGALIIGAAACTSAQTQSGAAGSPSGSNAAAASSASVGTSGTESPAAPAGSTSSVAPIPPAVAVRTSSSGPGSKTVPAAPSARPGGGSAATTSRPKPATTPVPPPTAGNIDQTVASVPVTTAKAVPLTRSANFGGKVSASIVGVNGITAEARGPGEIAGPAVAVTVEIENKSARSIDLSRVTVNVTNSKGNPASPLSGPPTAPFSGTLKPGGQSQGTYVFSVGAGQRSPIGISVSYSTDAPVLMFVGNAS